LRAFFVDALREPRHKQVKLFVYLIETCQNVSYARVQEAAGRSVGFQNSAEEHVLRKKNIFCVFCVVNRSEIEILNLAGAVVHFEICDNYFLVLCIICI
jgi:hypothetical protein